VRACRNRFEILACARRRPTVCIIYNQCPYVVQYHGQSARYAAALDYLNMVFTGVFTVEFALKLVAFKFKVSTRFVVSNTREDLHVPRALCMKAHEGSWTIVHSRALTRLCDQPLIILINSTRVWIDACKPAKLRSLNNQYSILILIPRQWRHFYNLLAKTRSYNAAGSLKMPVAPPARVPRASTSSHLPFLS